MESSKTASAVTGAPPLENKTSAVSDARSAPVEILPNPSEAASMRAAELQIKPKPYVHLSAHTNIGNQSTSLVLPTFECEEAPVVRSEMLLLGTDLVRSRSLVCTDQSSEEDAVDGFLEREDCLESSPGLVVLTFLWMMIDYRTMAMKRIQNTCFPLMEIEGD
ncbi:hypothetical protein RHSIM_Rhsim12G0182000 [Rhododendron simsii]|uniref:Uncharacterized protein n=1 Tax=Rhododendron simsii TaxID=118357 RepID=A0A834L871_RHOSS|nr:hypothetical protein RHSIM_Rhsim12G0182000 [Rhododendron simsii]